MAHLRVTTTHDLNDVRNIHLSAFPDSENKIVSTLAVNLLKEETSLSLVAEIDGATVGHIIFSPVTIDNKSNWTGMILSPVAVTPRYQKQQIGSEMIKTGIKRLTKMGTNVLFVYGDPAYYGRFGFNADLAAAYSPAYELEHPAGWQAIMLNQFNLKETLVNLTCVEALNNRALW